MTIWLFIVCVAVGVGLPLAFNVRGWGLGGIWIGVIGCYGLLRKRK